MLRIVSVQFICYLEQRLGTPMAGYSCWSSPKQIQEYQEMARSTSFLVTGIRPVVHTPDGGCQPRVALRFNTNARIDYETLRMQHAPGQYRSPSKPEAGLL